VKGVKGVVSVTPVIEGQVMATARGVAKGAMVQGFRKSDLKRRRMVSDNIKTGSLDDFGGDGVVVGSRLARSLGISVGERITLISPNGNITVFGSVPRMRSYRVAATFEIGMFEYDSTYIFMPLKTAQVYFRHPGAVTDLQVFVNDPDKAQAVGKAIRAATGGRTRVRDWQQANSSFFNAIQVERNVMFMILTLIILVAAFNIISSLIMLVKDKSRDIAILRTMGATRGTIMRIFFLAGASVGTIGTLAGFGLGVVFSDNIETIRQWIQGIIGNDLFAAEIYFLSKLPAVVDPAEVTSVLLMGLGLSFLATIYPAWRASRLDPAEALRYE
ncbi:MAG TPA: lipoprotein-releasing ABC transporter permease subunit, partial [Alphaproteobacteria bacterium]|nr:lipoprotein-releasing ABC transporter permease subunit [Alphaproteobacteria bacterium]